MRLICPNCDAEYEVDDSAIPDGGRDVQCSNCGHAWFQLPAEVEAAEADEDALFGAREVADPQPRRSIDENLMAILREEAEREAAARRAEAASIETQTEMPLEPPPSPSPVAVVTETARRLARLKGQDPDAAPITPTRPVSRRQLFPDIEEVNTSLRPAGGETLEPGDEPAQHRSSFRSGFALAIVVAGIAFGAYAMAPKIAAQIPGAKPAIDGYVARVDAGRLWLDGAMRRATAAIKGLTAAQDG